MISDQLVGQSTENELQQLINIDNLISDVRICCLSLFYLNLKCFNFEFCKPIEDISFGCGKYFLILKLN